MRFLPLAAALAALAHAQAPQPQLTLQACAPSARGQQFYYFAPNKTLILAANGYCIDILAWGTTPGSEAYSAPCHHEDIDPAHQNQEFAAPLLAAPGAPLVELMSGLALTAAPPIAPGAALTLGSGTPLYLRVASPAHGGTGALVHAASGLCVDAGTALSAYAPASLRACTDDRAGFQTLDLSAAAAGGAAGGAVRLLQPDLQSGAALCLTAADASPAAALEAQPCAAPAAPAAPPPPQQAFVLDAAAGRLSAAAGGDVDTLLPPGDARAAWQGLATALAPSAPAGTWRLQGATAAAARLVHAPSGLCLDLGRLPWGHACLDPAQRALPYCDATAALGARVADLLARLSTPEKVALTGANLGSVPGTSSCDTVDPGVPRLGIPPKQWLVETNSMIASQCYGGTCATAFPAALNLAASGNATLWREKGRVMSDEMRALNNLAWHRADGSASFVGLNGFGPDINQPRDPRNGRAGELVSEDPYLTGAYAEALLAGMQNGAHSPAVLKMTAGVKHFAGYSMETNRFVSKGNFSLYDLFDTYLVPYEAAFSRANASGSMCSYISLSIQGGPMIPACAHAYLLQTLTREFWGQPGAVHTSDCGAVAYMRNKGFTPDDTHSAAAALNGGMDLNSNTILPSQLARALALGLTNASVLDASVSRTLAARFRTGMLDPLEAQPEYMALGLGALGTNASRAVALEGTAQGLVLVRNEGGALPLAPGVRLAVVGPLAVAQQGLLGDNYADSVCPGALGYANTAGYACVPTLGAALAAANAGGNTTILPGVGVTSNDSSWGAAIAAAGTADAVVLVLGSDRSVAGEGTDLASTRLPGLQSAFAGAVLAAAARARAPVTLVLVSSFPLALEEVLGAPPPAGVAAAVLAYSPGFGASAVAGALFGANRWGRSVFTHYPAAYTSAVALGDFGMTPAADGSNPGRGYRYYNNAAGAPSVALGQGLSYNALGLACSGSGSGSGTLTLACNVSVRSGPPGEQVLQVFHRPGPGVVGRVGGAHPLPLRTLCGVTRVAVGGAGALASAGFALPEGRALGLVNGTGARVLYAGLHYLDVWDGSANNVTLEFEVAADADVSVPPLP